MRIAWALLGLMVMSEAAPAATIYLCEAYSGGTFWSSGQCASMKANIRRIVAVPDGMPFDQQVRLGEQTESNGRQLSSTPPRSNGGVVNQHASTAASECAALNDQVRALDAEARQPQSGQSQDRISTQRRAARDRQFWLGCR